MSLLPRGALVQGLGRSIVELIYANGLRGLGPPDRKPGGGTARGASATNGM